MKKMNFTTSINAPKEKVWEVLWDLDSYKDWTSVFASGSTVETDNWREGSRIKFLDGKGNGMISEVSANRPHEFMSFTHLGEIRDGKEDLTSDTVKQWSGAQENYTLAEQDGKTELKVEMDTAGADFESFLLKTWPDALKRIKELAESGESKKSITVETTVNAPIEKVWNSFTEPEHITKWYFANDQWHAPAAENDLRVGGQFKTRVEAKDGSFGFDYGGEYTRVNPYDALEFSLGDGRKVKVAFSKQGDSVKVAETFELEKTNSEELQRMGWQAILDNFKKHTESLN